MVHATYSVDLRADSAVARLMALALVAVLAIFALGATAILGVGLVERFDAPGMALALAWLALAAMLLYRGASVEHSWWIIGALLLLSLALRIWSAWLTIGVDLGADPMNYTNLARAVLDGRGLIVDDWRYGEDLRAYFPPLYPLALAGWWGLFGTGVWSTLAMNSLIDGIAAWALGDAARRLHLDREIGTRIGLAAAILYFAWPAFALGAGIPQKEALTILFVILLLRTLAIWLRADDRDSRRWRHGLAVGLWWGLLALAQPSLALAPVFVGLILLWQKGIMPVILLGLKAAPALLAVLLPWWIRNWLLFGHFIPFTTASGMMLNSAWRDERVPFPPGLFDLPEHERASIMGAKAAEKIAGDPVGFARQALKSTAFAFGYEEASLARFRHTTPPIDAADHARLAPVQQASYAVLLWSAALAGWRQFRRAAVDPVLLYGFMLLASILAINFWFEFGERHRLVLTPFWLVLGAGYWLALRQKADDAAPQQA